MVMGFFVFQFHEVDGLAIGDPPQEDLAKFGYK
jgi:hypothetical protein